MRTSRLAKGASALALSAALLGGSYVPAADAGKVTCGTGHVHRSLGAVHKVSKKAISRTTIKETWTSYSTWTEIEHYIGTTYCR